MLPVLVFDEQELIKLVKLTQGSPAEHQIQPVVSLVILNQLRELSKLYWATVLHIDLQ